MASTEILSIYIKKLCHPLKEIRERALQLLVAKLRLGWEMKDELGGTRDLLEGLLAWFSAPEPSLQQETLHLLLTVIKTEAGTYIAREFGVKEILANLNGARAKIEPGAMEIFQDVIDTLRFINTVVSEENVNVPALTLHSQSSESDGSSSNGYYNLGPNVQTSNETSISNDEIEINRDTITKTTDGIKMLLFPWVEQCSSDSKTMLLVEDALKLLKSTRRCCRFIRDVFLRDFPAEIFLNRPEIVQRLLAISDGGHSGRPGEALHVLFCITRALRARLRQFSSLDLIHEYNQVQTAYKDSDDRVNVALEDIAGDDGSPELPPDEALAALRQSPAPLYALDTLHTVLTIMARSVTLVDPDVKSEVMDMKELNTCLCLVECLTGLLLDCVSESFWCSEHSSKTHRDIAHKSCMVMRLLGDLLMKYGTSYSENTNRCHYRVAWLRLVSCAEILLTWARPSAMPPSSLVVALQAAQMDPALDLLYPELNKRIASALQKSRTSVDEEYKSKYRELTKLFASMEDAAQFMKNKNSCRNSKKVLTCIKNSLPVLELHLSEAYLNDVSLIVLHRTKDLDLNDSEWSMARSIALHLMAHNLEWVCAKFYNLMADMVRSVLVGDDVNQIDNEKCLTLLFDVSVLTEICCHGVCSQTKEVEESASEIMLYLLRGRLVLSEGCWWRLLASLLPVLPLLHVYAAHDTPLGQAICKSLELDIAECMGVSTVEVTAGLVRLLFGRCPSVKLDAAHAICRLLDDEKYLPPSETLRADVLMSALSRVQPHDFNVHSSPPSNQPQTTGLTQMLDVLKQDIVLDEHGTELVPRSLVRPALEPTLRRNTLQQLAMVLRQQALHDTFLQCDGLRVIVAILRMSMMVDDYLAFPECAISCVSVLNSVCFVSRHTLAKIPDLPALLLRVILVFPANDSAVLMSAQTLALVAWSGFALQELDAKRRRVPALPLSVTRRTLLPFVANSYWNTSSNAEHSSVEWLLSAPDSRDCLRVRWWCAHEGVARALRGAPPPPAPLALRPSARDLAALRAACPHFSATKELISLENATTHRQVNDALNMLESYIHLLPSSSVSCKEFSALPWQHMQRFLAAPPASARDSALLVALLHFIITYMDNVPSDGGTISWIKSSFIGNDASIISLLGRDELLPQQTAQEQIEVTQLHIHIVKVLLRCVKLLDHDDYDSQRLESLVKILFVCLERIDLKDFHMLGFLNELLRCARYALHSRYCKLSEDTLVKFMKLLASILSGCASGGGRKGQACRLDATLSLLALLRQIHQEYIPVQRWCEAWDIEVVRALVSCTRGASVELRAAALHIIAALAYYTQLLPQLLQAVSEESLAQFAAAILSELREANVVRSAAAALLVAVTARASPHSDVLECELFGQLNEHNFLENSVGILVDFCNEKEYKNNIEPNVPLSVLERRSELEVRATKCGDVRVLPSPVSVRGRVPPTPALVATIADVVYNVSGFARWPVPVWDERGLYRLLFRCASWENGTPSEVYRVRAAACRALAAAAGYKCVRATLAATKDCLHSLLMTLTPLDEDKTSAVCISARAQAMFLLASLLTEKSASASVWRTLGDGRASAFFHLLVQCLESDDADLQEAGLLCLTRLAQSASQRKHPDKTKDESRVELLDNLKSTFSQEAVNSRFDDGDGANNDCRPEYMVEEMCKVFMMIYKKLVSEAKCLSSKDDSFSGVCSCLSSVLSVSARSRHYCVHRDFPRVLLATLRTVRDRLSLQGSAEGIKSAVNNPTLRTLYWLLTVINCQMLDCPPAKESFADDNIAVSLNRLWPWCMLTEQLREAVMRLLLTFSNDCSKGWSSMSTCVSGRSLVAEVCALTAREAAQQSRPRADTLLLLCLSTLRHAVPHHHCRAIILKSEVLSCVCKLRGAGGGGAAAREWARLCEAAARRADGAAALLALRALPAAPPPLRARLLPALAHAARHCRAAVLQAPDLLELLAGTLVAGDTAEVVSAARAAWALAANNHKAKLLLRSAGVSAALQSALQRMRRAPGDAASQRALQLLIYTNTVLQTA